MARRKNSDRPGFDAKEIATLDRTLHEPARLSLAASLYVVESADFVFLQNQTGMTGGNLSSHLKKLENAGYITVTKAFENSRPKTTVRLNTEGRAAFDRYTDALTTMLRAVG